MLFHLARTAAKKTKKRLPLKKTHQVKGRLLLDVVVGQSAPVFQLLAGKDQSLLVRGDSLLHPKSNEDTAQRARGGGGTPQDGPRRETNPTTQEYPIKRWHGQQAHGSIDQTHAGTVTGDDGQERKTHKKGEAFSKGKLPQLSKGLAAKWKRPQRRGFGNNNKNIHTGFH